jgi:protein-L-isoaspartate(D-aspartate) O-methyltransferase
MDPFAAPRAQLIEILRQEGISDESVLAAIGRVRREAFVPAELAAQAYENVALPIGHRQTISQPFIVAAMTQALRLTPTSRVLEVGTGSGYQAAILAELAGSLVSVERVPELLDSARDVLRALGYERIGLYLANGSLGWERDAPYDAILAAAAGPEIPADLLHQLAPGGRLVLPVGTLSEQQLTLVERTPDGFVASDLGPVRFVPLVGAGAWPEDAHPEASRRDDQNGAPSTADGA